MGRAPVRLRQAVTEGERPFWGKSLKRNQTILFPACTSEDTRRECRPDGVLRFATAARAGPAGRRQPLISLTGPAHGADQTNANPQVASLACAA